jgi:hypothetical protein
MAINRKESSMSVPEIPSGTPHYIWPDPNQPGWWVDAWNGIYDNLDLALEDAANGVGTPWILHKGEGIIPEEEADRRRAAEARQQAAREAAHERTNRMLQKLAAQPGNVADVELRTVSRTAQNRLGEMAASWDRAMRAIVRAAEAVEHAANRWEEKAGEV